MLLQTTVTGTRSVIHGDLNLENILIGPGNLVWLIDFANTREGHPILDFAHLESEIITHVIADRVNSTQDFLGLLGRSGYRLKTSGFEEENHRLPLHEDMSSILSTLHEIVYTCLANPTKPEEYHAALLLSCLGAMKYRNLDHHQRNLLYLTGAFLAQDFSG